MKCVLGNTFENTIEKTSLKQQKVTWLLTQVTINIFLCGRGFTANQDYFTYFEPSQSLGGAKTGDPREKQLTACKQNLAILAYRIRKSEG